MYIYDKENYVIKPGDRVYSHYYQQDGVFQGWGMDACSDGSYSCAIMLLDNGDVRVTGAADITLVGFMDNKEEDK